MPGRGHLSLNLQVHQAEAQLVHLVQLVLALLTVLAEHLTRLLLAS